MKDSVSVIICCNACNMQTKMLWKTKETFQVFVFSKFEAKLTNKWLNMYGLNFIFFCTINVAYKQYKTYNIS